jgi:hypothetical protein
LPGAKSENFGILKIFKEVKKIWNVWCSACGEPLQLQ